MFAGGHNKAGRYFGLSCASFVVALAVYGALLYNNYFFDRVLETNYAAWQTALGASNLLVGILSAGLLNYWHRPIAGPVPALVVIMRELLFSATALALLAAALSQITLADWRGISLLAVSGLTILTTGWLLTAITVWLGTTALRRPRRA